MRTANVNGRLMLVLGDGVVDVEKASEGLFPSDPQAVFDRWPEFRAWSASAAAAGHQSVPFDARDLGAPVPRPRQVFAVGLNYSDHVEESALDTPARPSVFTKYPTSLAGPHDTIELPSTLVDWEVELVAVIGAKAHHVAAADAWQYIAGLTAGQDLSERRVQLDGPAPQFALGKSFPGFSPTGPVMVTPDEFANPDDLALGCAVGGETMQESRTSRMIFPLAEQIAWISGICPMLPGDLLFTGTPAGVGGARDPRRFLAPGEELHSWIENIGELRNPLIAGSDHPDGPHGRHAHP
ncbi:fumarylacetoacetate hydrolase family protein [Streptomyces sp. ISL-36]|uniref:fumarylacetoacetate hydrolase family protein n=1 Tax=Streptomyces sp. ISL-36 TaxID=2819182 RepID=UPI001BE7647C|nr:fumarylacetoacetate hydrolase family protein [Streptomyces sp. ISL-36]MBT2445143.1 fumarylacetoacetate hydrolase family protein [Streptomyces sp. ISL-36]